MAALSLCTLLAMFGVSAAAAALPTLGEAFAAPMGQAQWVVLAYLLAVTATIVGAGRLGDLFGRRRLLLGGLVVYAAGALLCAMAPTLWLLAAARAVQGVGAAVMLALAMAVAGDAVPKAQLGRAMGLLGTMSALGTASGPLCGGLLIAWVGWRAIFWSAAIVAVLTFLLARRYLPREAAPTQPKTAAFDLRGAALLMLTLAAYALGVTMGRDGFGLINAALLLAAALGALLFVWWEARTAAPLVQLAMFADPRLRAGLAASLLVSTVMMATLVVGPYYLAHGLALNAAAAGLVIGLGPLASAAAATPAGRAVDRFGAQRMTAVGLAVAAIGALGLAAAPAWPNVAGYAVAIVILTSGYSLFQTANNAAVMCGIPSDRRGVTAGLLNLSRNLGLITGASAMGALYAAFGMSAAFLAAAGLIAAALALILASRRTITAPAA